MTYGIRIKSSADELIYDSSTTTWTQLGIFFIDRLAVNPVLCSVQNSGMTEYSVTFWFLNTPPLDRKMLIPTYTISLGYLSFTHQDNSAYALVLGR